MQAQRATPALVVQATTGARWATRTGLRPRMQIIGLSGVPQAGEPMHVVENERR